MTKLIVSTMYSARAINKYNDDGPGAVIYAMCSLPAAGVTKTIRASHSALFGQPRGGDLAAIEAEWNAAQRATARQRSRQAQ